MDAKDNQDLTVMGKVALVREWLNKDYDFNFEVVNEGEHNLEELTEENTRQNRWINMFANWAEKHTQWRWWRPTGRSISSTKPTIDRTIE